MRKAKVQKSFVPPVPPQLREEVVRKRWPVGTGPVKVAPGKSAKVKVTIEFLSDGEKFFGTELINTGASDGLYLASFTLNGDKAQLPLISAPISVESFSPRVTEHGFSMHDVKLDGCSRGDAFQIEVKNTSKEEREFSMTIFGRVSKMVPVEAAVGKEDVKGKKPFTDARALAELFTQLHGGARLVDPEAVYKMFVLHAARFVNDVTAAFLVAAEAQFPQGDETSLGGIVEKLRGAR